LIERLAAEYVLGTLRGRARLRFARLAREDAIVAQAVREWEERLLPMSSAVPELMPPARVWRALSARLGLARSTPAASAGGGLWESLAFWRNLGLVASGCAAALVVALALQRHAPSSLESARTAARQQQSYVATLADAKGQVVLLAYAERNSDELWLKNSGMQAIDAGTQALQLWGLQQGAAPRSLGLIPAGEKGTIRLAAAADQALKDVPALAVSLEPKGGSPTGQPTGPVLYSGPCFKFW
jgi:anti-sigma-K factor RskA